MIWKKNINKNVSITHESRKTVVIVDGKEVDANSLQNNPDLLSLLNNSNLNSDLLSELMGATSKNNAGKKFQEIASNSSEKVECSSCSRLVSFAKGKCMYCGNPLQLKTNNKNDLAENDVDKKYLDTSNIEENKTETDADLNYINRLKDI